MVQLVGLCVCVTLLHPLCIETCMSSWLGLVFGPRRTAARWATGGRPTRRNDSLTEQPGACMDAHTTTTDTWIMNTGQNKDGAIVYEIKSISMCVPICLVFLFEVTGVDGVRVRPTAICTPPTLLFVFFLLFSLLFTFLFLLFGWNIVFFFLPLLCRAHLSVNTGDYKVYLTLTGSQNTLRVNTCLKQKWKNWHDGGFSIFSINKQHITRYVLEHT